MRPTKVFLTLTLSSLFAVLATASDHKRYDNPIAFQRAELDEKTGKILIAGNIWVMEADGSGLRQLTFGEKYTEHVSFYSDQENVLYAEFPANGLIREAGAKLIKHNIYTGKREVVAEDEGCALHHATVSPIDDLIAYHRDCGERVTQWVGLGRDGYEVTMLATNGVRTPNGIIAMHEKNRGVSPRRVSLAYFKGHGPGGTATLLTADEALHRRPAISPDGKWLAWQTNVENGEDEIFLAKVDGSEARNITKAEGNDGHPWFSRDGQWIVFESDRSGQWDIWRINLKTLKQEQLTDGGKKYSSTRARM